MVKSRIIRLVHLSPRGEQRIVEESGHMIPREDPSMVVAAVRDVIGRIQKSP